MLFLLFFGKICSIIFSMNTTVDLHTHSIASGHHTTDTVTDMAREAAKRGITYLGITEHAPAMPGACGKSYFTSLLYADKKLFGVNVLYGAELNVLNADGDVDLNKDDCKNLVYRIASLHKDVIKPQTEEQNTAALINVIKRDNADIIGHPDDPTFAINFHALTDAAKEYGKTLEFNAVGVAENGYRKHNIKGLIEMLTLCKKKGVNISLGSDSHGKNHIGEFGNIYKVLKITDFPENLIVNNDIETYIKHLKH